MRIVVYLIVSMLVFFSCPAKRELLVPVLLDYRLFYPDEAREQGLEGTAWVQVRVGEDGKTVDAQLARSSGSYLLDSAAVRTAQTFVFSPARKDEQPQESWVLMPIEFRLHLVDYESWITEVTILQMDIGEDYNAEKEKVDELYELYKQLIYSPAEIRDLSMNDYIRQTVLKSTARLWNGFWSKYPAAIILFIDIVKRYPDSFTSLRAKADFNRFLEQEMTKIRHTLSYTEADSLINTLREAVKD